MFSCLFLWLEIPSRAFTRWNGIAGPVIGLLFHLEAQKLHLNNAHPNFILNLLVIYFNSKENGARNQNSNGNGKCSISILIWNENLHSIKMADWCLNARECSASYRFARATKLIFSHQTIFKLYLKFFYVFVHFEQKNYFQSFLSCKMALTSDESSLQTPLASNLAWESTWVLWASWRAWTSIFAVPLKQTLQPTRRLGSLRRVITFYDNSFLNLWNTSLLLYVLWN